MPVSKKRKKKTGPPPQKIKNAAPAKKKISTQRIIIYIISGLMILSLAIGFLASGMAPTRPPDFTPTISSQELLIETPPAEDQANPEEDNATPIPDSSPEPTTESQAE